MTTTANTKNPNDPLYDVVAIADRIFNILPTIEGLEMENTNADSSWVFSFTNETLMDFLEKFAPGSITEGFLDSFHEYLGSGEIALDYITEDETAKIRMPELSVLNIGIWIKRNAR